jgi:hypothetical protein
VLRALHLVLVSGQQAASEHYCRYNGCITSLQFVFFYSLHLPQQKDEKSLKYCTSSLSQNVVLSSSFVELFM